MAGLCATQPARRRWAGVLVAAALAAPGLVAGAQHVNPRAAILQQFRDRVNEYVKFRNEVRSRMPKLKETSDPAEITRREQALGRALRAARAGAGRGDIFTPEVTALLRETIRANLGQRPPGERQAALSEVPVGLAMKVNDTYPPALPLATVPPTLLAQLPVLPDTLDTASSVNV